MICEKQANRHDQKERFLYFLKKSRKSARLVRIAYYNIIVERGNSDRSTNNIKGWCHMIKFLIALGVMLVAFGIVKLIVFFIGKKRG